ncbi:MAG: hypothetical protein Q8L41_01955 [Anaerolineales bacterium]|nr:hypothetical protein [Anaerolineales bacterium]
MDSEKLAAPMNETSLPSHSVDWRFLLPIYEKTKMLVICYEQNDYDRSFQELGIPIETMSFDKLEATDNRYSPLFELESFDVVAAPHGLNRISSMGERSGLAESLRSARRLIRPGGAFLLGFSNRWDIRRKRQESSYVSTTSEMSRLLSGLGYETKFYYGAVPERVSPEYIFPLDAQSLGFVLNHRYQHKLPHYFLKLTKTALVNPLLNFLPFYYVVAGVGG